MSILKEVINLKNLAIILLNYNGSVDTIECIESLKNTITNYTYDIYIIDNASREEEVDILKKYISSRKDFSTYSEDVFEKNKIRGNLLLYYQMIMRVLLAEIVRKLFEQFMKIIHMFCF